MKLSSLTKVLSTRVLLTGVLMTVGSLLACQAGKAISDRELSLAKVSVTDVFVPPLEMTNTSAPGDMPTTATDYPGQPPVVSHGIKEFLPITFSNNECMECHLLEEDLEDEPTPIPPSHYTDLRYKPDVMGEGLIGARYNCVICHVSLGANEPLVKNVFVPGR